MEVRGKMVEIKCNYCAKPKLVREADRKRGWGKFCNKTCKAKAQEAKTGQYRRYLSGGYSTKRNTHDEGYFSDDDRGEMYFWDDDLNN